MWVALESPLISVVSNPERDIKRKPAADYQTLMANKSAPHPTPPSRSPCKEIEIATFPTKSKYAAQRHDDVRKANETVACPAPRRRARCCCRTPLCPPTAGPQDVSRAPDRRADSVSVVWHWYLVSSRVSLPALGMVLGGQYVVTAYILL